MRLVDRTAISSGSLHATNNTDVRNYFPLRRTDCGKALHVAIAIIAALFMTVTALQRSRRALLQLQVRARCGHFYCIATCGLPEI